MSGKQILVAALLATFSAFAAKGARPEQCTPGTFDYYVLTLSWSPGYCNDHNDPNQCEGERRFGFVVHGLWPQEERGFRQNYEKTNRVPEPIVQKMLPLMPSERLIQHEWQTHGVCSGLGVQNYFAQTSEWRNKVKIPARFDQPREPLQMTEDAVRQSFSGANREWGMKPDGLVVSCSGKELEEVRICLTREGQPRPCSTAMRRNCPKEVKLLMRPVR